MNKRFRQSALLFTIALISPAFAALAQDAASPLNPLASADDPIAAEVLYTVPKSEQIVAPATIEALAKAAAQPDQETRLQTLQAIAEYRFAQLTDQVKALLADQRVLVRTAAVHAAAALQLKDTAETLRPLLTSIAPDSPEQVALLIELDTALAGFGDQASQSVWLARAQNPAALPALRVSAYRALIVTGSKEVGQPPLDASQPAQVRLAAADAFAAARRLSPSGASSMPDHYSRLLSGSLIDRLVAARMLASEGSAATPLLQRAAGDKEPAVQAIALAALKQRGAESLTLSIIDACLKSPDPKVRLIAIEGLPLHAVNKSVELAGGMMNDPHPLNRTAARLSLGTLAKSDMAPRVRTALRQAVDSLAALDSAAQAGQWGQAEQWPLLARDLNEIAVAQTLTKFLHYPRVEVVAASVKALRSLNVPSTHQAVLELFTDMVGKLESSSPVNDKNGEVARQVAMTLGIWRMKEADGILRHGIKKEHPLGNARAATIWALGLIHEGQFDSGLANLLNGRINDTRGLIPEADDVRMASVIALGRMKGKQSLSILRLHLNSQEEGSDMQHACQWAIQQITGEPEPVPPVLPGRIVVPFLSPLHTTSPALPLPAVNQ